MGKISAFWPGILFSAYVVGGVITFGHAYNHYSPTPDRAELVAAAGAGMFWPLYWTTWIW